MNPVRPERRRVCAPESKGAILLLLLLSTAARAQDRFEIQVYDAETAPPGGTGVELHLNGGGERVFHATLEPHVGVARWAEIGLYLQTATGPDGVIDFAGFKARFKARVPRRFGPIGLAANAELSIVPARYEPDVWGAELRPIVDLRWRRLYLAVNPILTFSFVGAPEFEPAAKASLLVIEQLAVGAEYYGAFAAGGSQRLLGALDFLHTFSDGTELSLNAAAGYDFTGPERWLIKGIIGIGR